MRTLRTALGRICLVAILAITGLGFTITSAQASVPFSQMVKLRNDPTHSTGHARSFSSFRDGQRSCWARPGSANCRPRVARGKIHVIPRTYKLIEQNRKYDYYLLDLEVTTSGRSGDKGYGYLDVALTTNSKVTAATHSGRRSSVGGCKKYPISIAAGWGPVSAGTTVGNIRVDCHSTSITTKDVKRGNRPTVNTFHLTNLMAVKSATFQRFVVVRAGAKPVFHWTATWPTDNCRLTTTSNGTSTYKIRSCQNSTASLSGNIGVRG